MYCNVDEAYDVKLIQNDCVYDEAMDTYHPKNMFSAQGELQDYENMIKDFPTGTSIEFLRSQTQPLVKPEEQIEAQVEAQEIAPEPIIEKCQLKEPARVCAQVATTKMVNNAQDDKNLFIGSITKKMNDIKNDTFIDFVTVGLKETAFLTLMGIIIIFLLDVLLRLGKKF